MSDGNQALDFIYLIGVLVLVGSALMVRRIPIGQSARMVAAWLLIFAAAFVVFALKDDFADLGRRVLAESSGRATVAREGETMRIRRAQDGHFWATAEINGTPVDFLIDSGATVTSISAKTARRAGISPSTPFEALVQTANGTVTVRRGRVKTLELGSIRRENLGIHIFQGSDDVNVLGMNFLSSLSRWGVEGRWLVLAP